MSELVRDVVTSAGLVAASLLLSVLLRRVLGMVLARTYKHTSSDLDDLIVKSLDRPIMLALLTLGVYGGAVGVLQVNAMGLSPAKVSLYSAKTVQILWVAFTLLGAMAAVRLLNLFARRYLAMHPSRATVQQIDALRKLLSIAIWALALVQVLGEMGYKISTLIATLGIAGLAVALALQDTLANVFAGFYIVADKSLKVGDYVKLDSGEEGFVEEVSWRNTRIRLWANNMVIVPNAKLIQSIITNYDLPQQQLSVYVRCGVGYDSDLDHVERVTVDVAREVLADVPGGVIDYEPVVRFKEFGDSNIEFVVVLRSIDASSQYLIQHEFIKRLHKRYRGEGINISYPVRLIVPAAERS